jgi:hypothetical protein
VQLADGGARPLLPLLTGMFSTEQKIHGLVRAEDKINVSSDIFYSVKRFWFDDERTKK